MNRTWKPAHFFACQDFSILVESRTPFFLFRANTVSVFDRRSRRRIFRESVKVSFSNFGDPPSTLLSRIEREKKQKGRHETQTDRWIAPFA